MRLKPAELRNVIFLHRSNLYKIFLPYLKTRTRLGFAKTIYETEPNKRIVLRQTRHTLLMKQPNSRRQLPELKYLLKTGTSYLLSFIWRNVLSSSTLWSDLSLSSQTRLGEVEQRLAKLEEKSAHVVFKYLYKASYWFQISYWFCSQSLQVYFAIDYIKLYRYQKYFEAKYWRIVHILILTSSGKMEQHLTFYWLYDTFSVVVECWVSFWSDFQSGSRVLKKVL